MTGPSTLTRTELRLFFREPQAWIWTVLFPVVLLAVLGSVPGFRKVTPELGARVIDLYVPILAVMALASMALFATPTFLATYRERGVLRRLSTTPARPTAVLVAQLAVQLTLAVVLVAVLILGGAAVFDTPLPHQVPGFLLALLLSVAAIFAIGLFIAAVAPSAAVASGIGTAAFFPLMFFAGLWAPHEAMPDWLANIADLTPLGAAVTTVQDSMAGDWPAWGSLAALAVYAGAFGYGAARLFRWQ